MSQPPQFEPQRRAPSPAEFDVRVKLAIYRHFAETARRPDLADVARAVGASTEDVRAAFGRLFESRVLVLEADGDSIRMAPPFSGVATQHRVEVGEREYDANCAWDSLGILAALHAAGTVHSRCEQSHQALVLEVALDGPGVSDWLFHCAVPASRWWEDIVHT